MINRKVSPVEDNFDPLWLLTLLVSLQWNIIGFKPSSEFLRFYKCTAYKLSTKLKSIESILKKTKTFLET